MKKFKVTRILKTWVTAEQEVEADNEQDAYDLAQKTDKWSDLDTTSDRDLEAEEIH